MAQHCRLQVRHVLWWHTALHFPFQINVELLGWVQLGGVWREIDHFDAIEVVSDPLAHHPGLVHVQVAVDEEYFASCVLDQSLHEHDQPLRAQAARVDHESHLALVCRRRDHRQALAPHGDPHDWCPARRFVAAMTGLVRADPRLVSAADLGISILCAGGDIRIFDREQVFRGRIVELIRTPSCLLRWVAPPRHVVTDSANRQPDAELTPHKLADSTTCPQRKWQRQLISAFAAYQLSGPTPCFRRQGPKAPLCPPTARHTLQHLRCAPEALEQCRDVRAGVSGVFRDLNARLALLVLNQDQATQLPANIRARASTIRFIQRDA